MKQERAFILLEYVLALPVLLLLILGIFDVCVLWNTKAGLQQGVETGLRCLTTPASSCYEDKKEEAFRYFYRTLGYEYQHPTYDYTASERWLEGPSMQLSNFRASVLDSVSLIEAAHRFHLKRKRYEGAYSYWEEVQRLPELSFSEASGAMSFRSPEIKSIREAQGTASIVKTLDERDAVHIMKVTQYKLPEGNHEAPCIQSWNKEALGGSCSPLQARVLLHLKARGAGHGKANLYAAIVSRDRKALKKHAPQWKSLGGQHYGAGNANFFPRGVSLQKEKDGSFVFLSELTESHVPIEFKKDYNRMLRLQDGEALWIKVEWESGHPLHLEAVDYYKSQYSYHRSYAPVLKRGDSYLPYPDKTLLPGGKSPLLDVNSVRLSGEEDIRSICSYSKEEAEAHCKQYGSDCQVVPGKESICLPSGEKIRKSYACDQNYGVKKNSTLSSETLFTRCNPSVSSSALPLHARAPLFKKKEISFPENIQLMQQSCSDRAYSEVSAIPEHLVSYADLRYHVQRKKLLVSNQSLDPRELKESAHFQCPAFQLKEHRIEFEEESDGEILPLNQEASCESAYQTVIEKKRQYPNSYIELKRKKTAVTWSDIPPLLCDGEALVQRLGVKSQWKPLVDDFSARGSFPQVCKDPLIECRKEAIIKEVSEGVNENEALRSSYEAAVAHAPLIREHCKSRKSCFSVESLEYGAFNIEARIDLPLKSLFILDSLGILDSSIRLEYSASDTREDLSHLTSFD